MPPSNPSAEASGLAARWQRRDAASVALLPVGLIFLALAAVRRALFRCGLLAVKRLPVPVVVVGNITVGGSGKTPLVIHLARELAARGYRPGIISRGYRGGAAGVCEVRSDSDPAEVGDEPLLLARRSGCPVFVGRDRAAAGAALLAAHPECTLILSDDGLQHYRLARDLELAVLDQRGVMNGWPLPAGPLREGVARLGTVAAIITNGEPAMELPSAVPHYRMRLLGAEFQRLGEPACRATTADFGGQTLHAVAGIGDPSRFFAQLRGLGFAIVEHPFPDHHAYTAADLNFGGAAILTTEKDAVKFGNLSLAAPVWVLPVTATVEPDLSRFIVEKLHGLAPA